MIVRGLVTTFLCALVLLGCGQPKSPEPAPEAAELGAHPLSFRFRDITEESGLKFLHVNGQDGRKLLPETLGCGAAFLDYDGDGHLDIFLVNGTSWGSPETETRSGRCALYRGQGNGRFEDVSRETRADIELQGMGCSVADIDGDGDVDIFITSVFENHLLVNEGGVFIDATEKAGLLGGSWRNAEGEEFPEWSTASVFFDADRDGDLDLFVCNYCEWSVETDIFTTIDGSTKAFTTPEYYRGLPCRLYLNDGGGIFKDATQSAGLAQHLGKALGVAVWDFDGDGLEEVIVANDTRPNFFFKNLGSGKFRELGIESGIAYDELGRARAGMGIDVQATPNSKEARVAIGNFAYEPLSLYRRRGDGTFSSEANRAGLSASTFEPLTFGLVFADFNLDGYEDLLMVNGHIEPDIARFREGQSHAQLPLLHLGLPDGRFQVADPLPGCALEIPLVGRGLAYGDIDEDGDLDLLITTNAGPARLYRNELISDGLGAGRAWRFDLAQDEAHASALGAILRWKTNKGIQERRLKTGSSYLSQSETSFTLGLMGNLKGEVIEILWPDGSLTKLDLTTPR